MIRGQKQSTDKKDFPHGFILSEAAQYAFLCQEVYPDIISFAAAIPDHLKPLFLIPIKIETIKASHVASRIASMVVRRMADGATPTGDTPEGDLFSYETFKNDDNEPTVPNSEEGSIFQMDDADSLTHHQEYNYDENIQTPTDTTFMEDVDMTQYWDYPYRTQQEPRHSSVSAIALILKLSTGRRIAIKPEELEPRAPEKIKRNSNPCSVSFTSYDKKSRVFTFAVECGNGPKQVQAALSDIDPVSLSCNCPFWRWNGPEFHAETNNYMLGQPFGTASPPNIRDPDRKYYLCKHAYAVLRRLDNFVAEVTEENWDLDDDELLDAVDEEWDRLEGAAEIPPEELDEDELDIDIDWEEEPEGGLEAEPAEPAEEQGQEEESYDVDLSDLETPEPEPDYSPEEDEKEEPDYEAPAEEEEEPDYETPEEKKEEKEEEEEEEEEESQEQQQGQQQ